MRSQFDWQSSSQKSVGQAVSIDTIVAKPYYRLTFSGTAEPILGTAVYLSILQIETREHIFLPCVERTGLVRGRGVLSALSYGITVTAAAVAAVRRSVTTVSAGYINSQLGHPSVLAFVHLSYHRNKHRCYKDLRCMLACAASRLVGFVSYSRRNRSNHLESVGNS